MFTCIQADDFETTSLNPSMNPSNRFLNTRRTVGAWNAEVWLCVQVNKDKIQVATVMCVKFLLITARHFGTRSFGPGIINVTRRIEQHDLLRQRSMSTRLKISLVREWIPFKHVWISKEEKGREEKRYLGCTATWPWQATGYDLETCSPRSPLLDEVVLCTILPTWLARTQLPWLPAHLLH